MRKLLTSMVLVLMAPLAVMAASGSQVLVNEAGLTYNTTYPINLNQFGTPQSVAGKLSVQVNWSSVSFGSSTFTDGAQSTMSITVSTNTGLLMAQATDQITVPTTQSILGSPATGQITISTTSGLGSPATGQAVIISTQTSGTYFGVNGNLLFVDTYLTNTTSGTASNLATALNALSANTGVAVAWGGGTSSTIYATTTVNGVFSGYKLASSSLTAISSGSFSGGVNNAVITIAGLTLTANKDFTVVANSTTTALNLATAIDAYGVLLASNSNTNVVSATATANGYFGNAYTMTTTTAAAIAVSSSNFSGGLDRSLLDAYFTINGNRFRNGYHWTDTSNTSTGTALSIAGALNISGFVVAATTGTLGTAATGYIVVITTPPAGSTITIVGLSTITLTTGYQWQTVATTTGTALALSAAINLYSAQTGIVTGTSLSSVISATATFVGPQGNNFLLTSSTLTSVSSGTFVNGSSTTYTGSVVFTTVTIGGSAGNSYTLTASTGALTIASPTFTMGADSATITINGVTLTAGTTQNSVTFSTASTTTSLALNISSAIVNNPTLSKLITSSTGTISGQAVVFSTSILVGANQNFSVASSSQAALYISSSLFAGGVSATFTLNKSTITLPGHGWTKGLEVVYSTSSGITETPLVWGTTYYVIVIDSNNIALATTSTAALQGIGIVITSSGTQVSSHTFVLTPETFSQGAASGKFQVSNDGINYLDFLTTALNVSVSSFTFTPTFPSTAAVQDYGFIDYNYLQFKALPPSQGGMAVKVILNAKD